VSTSCPFCRIVAGGAPADVLHETDTVVAFRDLRPQAPAHILLIPKEHLEDLTEIGDEHGTVLVDIVKAAVHLAETEGIHESGWRLVANVGPDAGQSVFHLHFHLLGGRPMSWPPG
jgi:histidine triad (HIT) family protein